METESFVFALLNPDPPSAILPLMLMSRFAAVTILLLAVLPIAAQQPQFSQKIEVKLVEIDVSVTGRDGKPVHGLTADDFEIFEGRSRQQITNFTEYRSAA